MEKRKIYFETQKRQFFPDCITAVGKGLRESWGTYHMNRKTAIRNLKKKCENWSNLAEDQVKLAWHSRKLRTVISNVRDLSTLLKFEVASYTGKEINWMRKNLRGLKKTVERQTNMYKRLAIQLQLKQGMLNKKKSERIFFNFF